MKNRAESSLISGYRLKNKRMRKKKKSSVKKQFTLMKRKSN
jgi:hypothetical protein